MKKVIVILITLVMVLAVSGPASAATATANLNVSATLVAACTVSTSAVDFGTTDGTSPISAYGDIQVTCPSGLPYNIALDAGNNTSDFVRHLSNGDATPALAAYYLYKDGTNQWGDSDFENTYLAGSSLAGTGTGILVSHPVYGALFGMSGPPGTYTDVVVVTVHY